MLRNIFRSSILSSMIFFAGAAHSEPVGRLVDSLNRIGVSETGQVYMVANHGFSSLCGDLGSLVQIVLPQDYPNHDVAVSMLLGAYLAHEPVWFSLEQVPGQSRCEIVVFNLDNR